MISQLFYLFIGQALLIIVVKGQGSNALIMNAFKIA